MPSPRRKPGRPAVEWVAALVVLPAKVLDDQGVAHRPRALLWLDADGAPIAVETIVPGDDPLSHLADTFHTATTRPAIGRPHTPDRVRTESRELAAALRAAHPELTVVVAPTPEVATVVDFLADALADADDDRSYLATGLDPEGIAALFTAAAELARAAPWELVPGSHPDLGVTIEALGLRDGVVTVIGQMAEHFGILLFDSADDYEAYLDAAHALEEGELPVVPTHRVLELEPETEISPQMRDEIAEHEWPLAGPESCPWVYVMHDDGARPPSATDLRTMEALARAIPELLRTRGAELERAWNGGARVEQRVTVPTRDGDVEVVLRAGDEPASEVPWSVIEAKNAELARAFAEAPEARALADTGYLPLVLDLASRYLQTPLESLDGSELRHVLFDLVPRKVSIEPAEARALIEEARAFYAFRARERGSETPAAIRRVLGDDAVSKLESALADPSKFGMAKSFVMGGIAAGYDMETPEGMDAWMRASNGHLGWPPAPPTARAPADRAKKAKRKAARKSRKKNR